VHGKVSEVTGGEKQKGLLELLKKYSPGFVRAGLQYIENAGGKTRVYKYRIYAREIEKIRARSGHPGFAWWLTLSCR